jgi:hypothetical protein
MPTHPILGNRFFDPESIRIMSDALTSVCSSLRLADRDHPDTQLVAERIIAHVQHGVNNRRDLYAIVVSEFSKAQNLPA